MKRVRRAVLLPLVALLFSSAFAQSPTAAQSTHTIVDGARATLPGSRAPLARLGEDLGALPSTQTISGIALVFKRTAAQQQDLDQLLTAQQTPGSQLYHHWLTPAAFASRFGASDDQIAQTQSWLTSRGFHIDTVSSSRDRITFSGTASQVQAAFGSELHIYRFQNETHFGPATDLTLPSSLAAVTSAVLHLTNLRPHPNSVIHAHPRPAFTTGAASDHYLSPGDIATMYDVTPVYKLTDSTGANITGKGQNIAIVGQTYLPVTTGINQYLSNMEITSSGAWTQVLVPGTGTEAVSPDDLGESQLDVEYSAGIATGANLFFVYVGDNQNYNAFDALAYAITTNLAPVISVSYGICEPLLSASDLSQGNALFQQAAAQGQTIIVASGDYGSTGCAGYTTADGVSVQQQEALAVDYPASSPYVTAIGGTQMAPGTFAPGASTYWNSSSLGDDVDNSLLSWAPEVAWNEDSATYGIAAGGGGASLSFARPAWQTNVPGIPSGQLRLVPDIALQASIDSPGFILCAPADGASGCGGDVGTEQYAVAGGTSFGAPSFAAMIVLLNQATGSAGQGNLNPTLYGLAANAATYASVFHDITSGTIACPSTVTGCAAPGESGYAAATGYDEATGLGSLDFARLIAAWPANTSPVSLYRSGIDVSSSPSFITDAVATAGETATLNISVSAIRNPGPGYPPVPTGTATVSIDGTPIAQPLTLSPSATPLTNPYTATSATALTIPSTVGTHILSIDYSGDASVAASTAQYSFSVGTFTASGTIALSAANLTVANNSTGTTKITITPAGGYNGQLTWTLAEVSGPSTALTACYTVQSSAVNGPTTATLNLGTGTACSSSSSNARRAITSLKSATSNSTSNSGGSASSKAPAPAPHASPASIVACAGLLLLTPFALRRRRLPISLLAAIALFAVACAGLSGCGGNTSSSSSNGSSSGSSSSGVSGSYVLKVTATDSVNTSITSSANFTLTVN